MKHEIFPFCFDSHAVRVVQIGCDPWFVAKDVCMVLGYTNPSKTLSDHLDDDERSNVSLGRQGKTNIISESGLYTLIIRSNKPQAKPFRRWVTKDVLPQIRQTGTYSVPANQDISAMVEAAVTKALTAANRKRPTSTNYLMVKMLEETPPERLDFLHAALPLAHAGINFSWQVTKLPQAR